MKHYSDTPTVGRTTLRHIHAAENVSTYSYPGRELWVWGGVFLQRSVYIELFSKQPKVQILRITAVPMTERYCIYTGQRSALTRCFPGQCSAGLDAFSDSAQLHSKPTTLLLSRQMLLLA